MPKEIIIVAITFFVATILLLAVTFGPLVRTWLRAFLSGALVPFPNLIMMRLRGNPPLLLIDAYIVLKHQGVSVSIGEIEKTYIVHRSQITASDDLVELVKKTH